MGEIVEFFYIKNLIFLLQNAINTFNTFNNLCL